MEDTYALQYEMMEKFKELDIRPVIMCIGSTKVTGDCLGPIVGELLIKKYNVDAAVYGNMKSPITAFNIEEMTKFVELMHGGAPIIAIDAAVGSIDSIGQIKIYRDGIYPGLATGKVLGKVGKYSIIGVVEERSAMCEQLLLTTRLQFVEQLAEKIAKALSDFLLLVKSRDLIMKSTHNSPQMSSFA